MMTEFPTPLLNKLNGVPELTADALPTEAELESGAQHAIVWLVGAFARACAQIRETGRAEFAFSDEAFASRICPEIAACLDEQVRWLGRTPAVCFSPYFISFSFTRSCDYLFLHA